MPADRTSTKTGSIQAKTSQRLVFEQELHITPGEETEPIARANGNGSALIRPLGAFEHLFWLADQHLPRHFVMVAQVTGKVTTANWRLALNRVQKRHPLLSVSIEDTPGFRPHFRSFTSAPIPLRIVLGKPETDWKSETAEELVKPFDFTRAPLVRAVLILSPQSAAFLLVAHHTIADGLSLAFVMRDVLDSIAGKSLEPLPFPPSQDENLGLPGTLQPSDDPQPYYPPPTSQPSAYRPKDNARPKIRALRLPAEFTTRLRERARQEETTVHGALSAALVLGGRLLSAKWFNNPVRVSSPVETKTMLHEGESCSLSLIAFKHTYETSDTNFWDMARAKSRAGAEMKIPKTATDIVIRLGQLVANNPDVDEAARFVSVAFAREGMVSNLGALPFASRYGALKLEALWGPLVSSGFQDDQYIGAVTVNGSLCLTHTSFTPYEGLLEAMQRSLVRATYLDAPAQGTVYDPDAEPEIGEGRD